MACNEDNTTPITEPVDDVVLIKTSEVINNAYIGNGAQWNAYPNAYLNWDSPISDSDWNKMYQRLDFMKPKLMRVTIAAGWKYARNGAYDPDLQIEPLGKILQYCTDNNITVMFGDWGGNMVDASKNTINEENLADAAKYADYLINNKGYSCIKYYNMVNEPNGDWSSTNGSYDLWKNAIVYFYNELENLGLTNKLSIVGPDVAIWDKNDVPWVTNSASELGDKIGLYDIHTYPGQTEVRNHSYSDMIKAYIDKVPAGKKMVMGELGFKYPSNSEASLYNENKSRAEADEFASNEDGNMFVKDFFYGIDMADAVIQIANSGYSGVVAWMLDDAMHNTRGDGGKDLKTWGFWNILGEEIFGGAKEEELRPWFYSYSLLSRYMQTGSKVYKVELPDKYGLNALAVSKNGKYMIAVLNSGYPTYQIKLKSDNEIILNGAKKFVYSDSVRPVDSNDFPTPVETGISLNLGAGLNMDIAGQSLTIFTNFDY